MNFFLANTNQVICSKPHYNRRYSFEVCIHWESDICWQVDILLANQECCSKSIASKKRTLVQKPQGADCRNDSRWFFLLPSPLSPLPHRFPFRPRISFRAVVSLTLQSTKEKTHQKNASYVRRLCLWEITSTPYYDTPSFLPLAVIRLSAIAALRVETSRPLEGTLPKLHFLIHVCLQFNCAKI